MNTEYEPCSICELYICGHECHNDKCPVAKMKAEVKRLKWEKEAETHGDIERERIEAILKKHGAYILSTIDGRGCHVGCYKGIALDADANWIIEAEVESMSETNCGDFVPVVHGEWINCNGGNATCSHCKTRQKNVYDDENEQRFCGHCGAKMDGGANGTAQT